MRHDLTTAIAILATIAAASAAPAQGTWVLGAVVAGDSGVYVGQDNGAQFMPYIAYETTRFEVSVFDGLTYHALHSDGPGDSRAQLSFVLTPRWQPDFGTSPLFDGLERETAIEAGIQGRYETGPFFAEARAVGDVSDTHNGYETRAFAGVRYDSGTFSVEGGIGARYRSDDLNQHLYGVSASEATAARPAFALGSGTTGFLSVSAAYTVSSSIALVGEVSLEDLGLAKQSPLVDASSNTSIAIGLIYQF